MRIPAPPKADDLLTEIIKLRAKLRREATRERKSYEAAAAGTEHKYRCYGRMEGMETAANLLNAILYKKYE